MSLSVIQINELVNKHTKNLELQYNIHCTSNYQHRTSSINHLKNYISGTSSRNTLFNHLHFLKKYITFTNINNVCNNTINAIDTDISIRKTQNINATNAARIKKENDE